MCRLISRVLAVAVLFVSVALLLSRGVAIQTSLFDLLPHQESPAMRNLERMAKAGSRQVNVLIKGDSVETVVKRAEKIRRSLPEGVTLMISRNGLLQMAEILRPYRFQLLSDAHRSLLKEQGPNPQLRDEALANLYSFLPLSLFPVDEEPYGFVTSFLLENSALKQNGFRLQDDMLLAEHDGVHYAYLPLLLPETAEFSLPELQSAMQRISDCCDGEDVMLSGTPVHTWIASASSQNSMTMLSIVSSVIVLVLFLGVFRSMWGLVAMSLTLVSSGVVSIAVASLIYGNVHILALVFGCSLVGISSDYVVHYLVDCSRSEGTHVSSKLRNSLLLGLMTSVLGYSAYFITQVDLLYQIATISVVGLSSTMLFVLAFYPVVFTGRRRPVLSPYAMRIGAYLEKLRVPVWLPWFVVTVCIGLCLFKLETRDDLRSFYQPSPALLNAEKEMAMLNGMQQGVITLCVNGTSEEQVLQRQEELAAMLRKAGISTSTYVAALIPSASIQKENFELVRAQVDKYAEEVPVDMPSEWEAPLLPAQLLGKDSPFASMAALWSEQSGVVLIPGSYREQLETMALPEWVEWADRYKDMKMQIQSWREYLMLILGGVMLLVILMMSCYAGVRSAFRICGPAFAGVLAVAGGLAICGQALTLFHVLACYLILGLGCDYAIFKSSAPEDSSLLELAVLLSFLTSWFMFGVLAITEFSVTHDMGVAVSIGLTVAYVLSSAAKGAAVPRCTASCEPLK